MSFSKKSFTPAKLDPTQSIPDKNVFSLKDTNSKSFSQSYVVIVRVSSTHKSLSLVNPDKNQTFASRFYRVSGTLWVEIMLLHSYSDCK